MSLLTTAQKTSVQFIDWHRYLSERMKNYAIRWRVMKNWRRQVVMLDDGVAIPLGNGGVAIVSHKDYWRVASFAWHRKDDLRTSYAATNVVVDGTKKTRTLRMHSVVLSHGKGVEVDHIDGDGLNNRRENLRACSHQQNMANTKKKRGRKGGVPTSRFIGVSFNSDPMAKTKPWRAGIGENGKRHGIGSFETEEAAAIAFNASAFMRRGRYAKLNQVTAPMHEYK
jgi:hypothetical protein